MQHTMLYLYNNNFTRLKENCLIIKSPFSPRLKKKTDSKYIQKLLYLEDTVLK